MYGEGEVPDEELVAEGHPELRVPQEYADLADRLAAYERIVVAVRDRSEEAVAARPLGGHDEVGVVDAVPVGEHDLSDSGPVYEFFGNGHSQSGGVEAAGLDRGRLGAPCQFSVERCPFDLKRARRHCSPWAGARGVVRAVPWPENTDQPV